MAAAIEERLAARSPLFADADEHARKVLANQLARCELVYRWINENGVIDEDGKSRPVMVELVKWESAARQMMRELGMSTLSRVELGLDQLQLQRELVDFQELQAALRAAMEIATRYVPAEQRSEYLEEVRRHLATAAGEEANRLDG